MTTDPKVRIKLAAAAALLVLALLIGLRARLFPERSNAPSDADIQASEAVVADTRARQSPPSPEQGNEATYEHGGGKSAQPVNRK